MDNILLLSLCIIPGLILLWYVYFKDKIEKEPLNLLIVLFIGGTFACAFSIFLSVILKRYIGFLSLEYSKMNVFQIIFKILFTIAIVEEGSKWIINYVTIWKNKNFDHIYDPIVYCTYVSIGFATLENILYGNSFGSQGIFPIIMRGFISVPSHAVFGIFMGYYLGISKNALMDKKTKQFKKYRIMSIIVPICLHLIYDLFLIKNSVLINSLFAIYIMVLYFLAYQNIKKLSSIHKKLVQK